VRFTERALGRLRIGGSGQGHRNPAHLPDRSYQARPDDMNMYMIDANLAMTGADGTLKPTTPNHGGGGTTADLLIRGMWRCLCGR
jgi:hypothetical protein